MTLNFELSDTQKDLQKLAKDFAEKAAISYAVARRIIKNGVLPEPIYLKVAGQDRIHWSKFCEWLAVPGNAKKLENI